MEVRPPGQLKQMQQNQAQAERKKQQSSEAEKRSFRKYNKSELGRKRYRRWRQSAKGKAKLKERYEARKAWLDEIKAQHGCRICITRNPLLLRFQVRPGERVKFSPELKNIWRDRKDWVQVITHCDIVCLNCQKTARRRVSDGQQPSDIPRESIVNDLLRGDRGRSRADRCKTCLTKFKAKSGAKKREFCSDRCRLRHWAAKEVVKAFSTGQAQGLRGIIAELVEIR
jgi:endogenous inhibitor of DNA gyrase (YacG/DUF329 family)